MNNILNISPGTNSGDKPVVVVSRCLEFDKCRYNRTMIQSPEVAELKEHVHFVPVCPEVEIELGIPRPPIRIISQQGERRLIQPDTGRDLTGSMNRFIASFTAADYLPAVDGFILKEKSPSCGLRRVKIYPAAVSAKPAVITQGAGFFGAVVLERFAHLPVEDEEGLTHFKTWDHFLTHLYAAYRFRKLQETPSVHGLVDFQARYKLVMMAYNQLAMRRMGRITANLEKKSLPEVMEEYSKHFYRVFTRAPRHTVHINVLQHALGYLSRKITYDEREFFLHLLNQYQDGKQSLRVCTNIMKTWIIRFGIDYLRNQYYFEPYPEDLMNFAAAGSES